MLDYDKKLWDTCNEKSIYFIWNNFCVYNGGINT